MGGVKEVGGGGETGLFDGLREVEDVVALRNGDLANVDVAAGEAVADAHGVGAAVEAVLAGFEGALAAQHMHGEEGVFGADNAIRLQLANDVASGPTGTQEDEPGLGDADGQEQGPCDPGTDEHDGEQEQGEKRTHLSAV